MAIIADKHYNLRDYAAQFGADSRELAIAEVLSKKNEIINDMLMVEGSLDSGHEYAVRTGIPAGTWRIAYQGIQPTKGTTKLEIARPGLCSAYSVVDKDVAEKGGHVDAVRAGQAKAIIKGMSDTVADALIHGGKKELAKCVGLEAHYNALSGSDSTKNVVNAGSSTDDVNSSIYLVVWDTDKVCGFFPKGSKAGIERTDYGLTTALDADSNEYPAYKEYFAWKLGLAVVDWRFAGRICNIKTTDLANVDILGLMQDLEEKIESLTDGKPVFYMNRTVRAALRKQIGQKANVQFNPDQPSAKSIMHIDEIPVHICDAILNTEKVVA